MSTASNVQLNLKNIERLTSKQRVMIRKSLVKRSKEIKRRMKSNAHKISGALRQSIGEKISVSKTGVKAIIGVKSHFLKSWKGHEKLPNRYAKIQEEANRFISRSMNDADVRDLQRDLQAGIEELLR